MVKEITKKAAGEHVLAHGKFKGDTVAAVAKSDAEYFAWFCKGTGPDALIARVYRGKAKGAANA